MPRAVVSVDKEPLSLDSTARSKPERVCKEQLACLSQTLRLISTLLTGPPDFPSLGSSTKSITEQPLQGRARSESVVKTAL
eukprot:642530-Pleurochrysis_carterae.AAC.1